LASSQRFSSLAAIPIAINLFISEEGVVMIYQSVLALISVKAAISVKQGVVFFKKDASETRTKHDTSVVD
jgi:hypothetical protein